MTLLPVVERELRVAARNPLTRWLRWGAVLVLFGLMAALLVANSGRGFSRAELPKILFMLLSSLIYGWCLLSGVVLTADCLSREKRQGTLGLLFLTDLSSFDVVLGKAAVAIAQAFSVVLATLPVLALPLLMGAVSFGEFWRIALALLGTLAWSLSIGLAASALHSEARTTVMTALGVILAQLLVPLLVVWGTRELTGQGAEPWLMCLTPLTVFGRAFEAGRITSEGRQIFQLAWWVLGMTTAGCLAFAAWRLPRSWQDVADQTTRTTIARLLRRVGQRHPYEWLLRNTARVPRLFYLLFTLGSAVWVVVYLLVVARPGRAGSLFQIAMLLLVGLHLLVKIAVAISAAQRTGEDSAAGAMELLLTTPLQPREIVGGHHAAFRGCLYGSKLVLTVFNLLLVFLLPREFRNDWEPIFAFGSALLGGIVLLWLDSRVLTELGLFLGLRRRQQVRAAAEALARVLVPGWLGAFGVFLVLVAGGGNAVVVIFLVCVLWCVGCDVWLLQRTRRRLPLAFVELAEGRARRRPVGPASGLPPAAPALQPR